MNNKQIRNIVREYMENIIIEQDIEISPYTPEEEKFLAKFPELKTTSIGIIYSKDTTGVREFLNRSGKDFNLTPNILHSLLKKGTVSIVPYGGYARNEDYTLQLNIPLEDLEGLSSGPAETDQDKAIATEESVESSHELANLLVTEQKRHTQSRVYAGKSRTLKRLPKGYINYLERIIQILGSKLKNEWEREQLVADILDNLAHNFGLTPKQVYRSFIYYRSQNRLANVVRESLDEQAKIDAYKEKGFSTFSKWVQSTFPARYIDLLSTPGQFTAKARIAVQQFSEDSIKLMANDWDKWVESTGARKIEKRKAKIEASFEKIPGEQTPGTEPEVTNEKILIDLDSLYKDKQVSGVGSEQKIYNQLKQRLQEIAQLNSEPGTQLRVGVADYQVYSSTSKVPSNPSNDVLAKGRAGDMQTSFRSAVTQLQKELGLYLGDMKELTPQIKPNQGPNWPDKDAQGNPVANTTAAKTAAYGPQGNRNDHYEATYKSSRKSYVTVSLSIAITIPGTPAKEGQGRDNANWVFSIREKTKKIPPPRIPRIPPGLYPSKGNPGECFSFKNPAKLKKIAPLMAFGKGTRSSEKQFSRQKKNL